MVIAPDPTRLIPGTAPPDNLAALCARSGTRTIVILWHLRHGPVPFTTLKRASPDIARNMLTTHGRTLQLVFQALSFGGAAHPDCLGTVEPGAEPPRQSALPR
jgi:hypothetical protein